MEKIHLLFFKNKSPYLLNDLHIVVQPAIFLHFKTVLLFNKVFNLLKCFISSGFTSNLFSISENIPTRFLAAVLILNQIFLLTHVSIITFLIYKLI